MTRTGRTSGKGRRAARRRLAGTLLGTAVLLGVAAGCDRETETAYAGDPEGRIVTAGTTADALVSRGATARRIAAVELSAGLVERWFSAQERLEELAASDADVRRLLDERDDADGGESAIEDAARHLERDARVRSAIESAGLSTGEFVLTALALHQALLASSPGASEELRSLAARNVRFVGRNAALLERLAAPPPPPVLAYGDTLSQYDYGAFVDTSGGYDVAPYDLTPYGYVDTVAVDTVAVDTAGGVVPPVLDTLVPPVVTPPLPRPAPVPAPLPPVTPPVVPPARPRADSTVTPRPGPAPPPAAPVRRDSAATPPSAPPPTSPPPR